MRVYKSSSLNRKRKIKNLECQEERKNIVSKIRVNRIDFLILLGFANCVL